MIKMYDKKYNIFKLDYWQGAKLVGKFLMPTLAPNQFIPENVISFNERKSFSKPEKHWLNFFIDDIHYETFWTYLRSRINSLKKFAGIISTDYSMLPEMLPGQRIWNCTRNRIVAYCLQKQGFNVIPVASWCSIDYHNIDGKMSLHKHVYINGIRQKEHIEPTPTEYAEYSKFLNR